MASQSISTLNVKLTADGRALLNEFKKSQQGVREWAGQIERLKTSMGTLISADLIAGGVRSMAGAFKDFVGDSLKAAADLEAYQLQFETIFQSASKAKEVIQQIYDFADATPFASGDLVAAAKQLSGYQIAAKDILPTLKTLGDIAAVSGASLGDLSEIYGRVVSDGRAMNEDLNRLADRSIPIYSELAKVIGVSTGEVRKLASEGKISAEQVQQAFINMTTGTGQFSGAIERLAGTSAGQLSTLQDTIEGLKRSFGEGLLPTMKEFVPILTEIVSGGQAGADSMSAFREAGETVGQTLRVVGGTLQIIRADIAAFEEGVLRVVKTMRMLSGQGIIDWATGSKQSEFNQTMIDSLKKQREDLMASAGRLLNLDQPVNPPKASSGVKQAGIESIIQPAKSAEQAKQELTQATEAAAQLAKQSKEFAETARKQIETGKWFFQNLFKPAGTDGATSSPQAAPSPIDAAAMIKQDIFAAVEKARAELRAVDEYLGRGDQPTPERVAERAGVINFGDYQKGKYGPISAPEYFNNQGAALKALIESMGRMGGTTSERSKVISGSEKSSAGTAETANNVTKLEHRLVSEMSKDRTLLNRMATALERKDQSQIKVKVYGV